ncbi:polyphosphoinositide phosphatase-like [Watersipora subatra]|uniref:polyphosphoinositide phosphatase-like n=1 Tax=Watersipora subatra TaxID=2589382 RepID=UPI00355BC2B8
MSEACQNFVNIVQKITIYETKETLYVVGSDETEQIFRILEINRNDRQKLVIQDLMRTYTMEEARTYLQKISQNEKRKMKKIASGYSLAGFVRFTEGYYLILVTSRLKVAMIGSHVIYKVEGTAMIYVSTEKVTRPEELRYAKLFENVDFSNNFYFSYSYDLTHSLQYNQTQAANIPPPPESVHSEVRQRPLEQFLWNKYLLEPVKEQIHDDWIVYLIHGFLSQVNMIVFGRHIYITLISRRSSQYAGTRFMKRGCNTMGYPANEVETEQIVHDVSQTSLDATAFTSFVQLRGSIPLFWSQDLAKAMSKPPISLDFTDPYGGIAGTHFRNLLRRYGAPVIILSLVKRRERRRRESVLWDELVKTVTYLNQFMKDEHKIRYVAFDMARSNRKKGANVLAHLDDISESCIKRTGFYVSNCLGYADRKQHGVIRTNCVDCLDRTNTAQFSVGKHALGHQLHALGVTPSTELFFDTDCVSMLEALYEDQGDTIALQYGGSNLVHRVQSYRKTDLLSAHSNDILQTLARYYKNSFSDSEKQQAYNVFLGIYRPFRETIALWDLPTDYYLHNRTPPAKVDYCQWVAQKVIACLPQPFNEVEKELHIVHREAHFSIRLGFNSVYRVMELTLFDSLFYMTIRNSIKSFMSKSIPIDYDKHALSPFEVRKTVRWTQLLNTTQTTPSGQSKDMGNSIFHTGTTTEDPDSSSSEESDIECKLTSDDEVSKKDEIREPPAKITFHELMENPFSTYGVDSDYVCPANIKMYKHYEKFYNQVTQPPDYTNQKSGFTPQIMISQKSILPLDSEYEATPPSVNKETKCFYKYVVTVGLHGTCKISPASQATYHQYVQQLHQ